MVDAPPLVHLNAKVRVTNPKRTPGLPEWVVGIVKSIDGDDATVEIIGGNTKLRLVM